MYVQESASVKYFTVYISTFLSIRYFILKSILYYRIYSNSMHPTAYIRKPHNEFINAYLEFNQLFDRGRKNDLSKYICRGTEELKSATLLVWMLLDIKGTWISYMSWLAFSGVSGACVTYIIDIL